MKETFALNVEKHAENNYKQLFSTNLKYDTKSDRYTLYKVYLNILLS